MFLRSVRFKILIWYALFLAVTLFFFSMLLYGTFRKNLYDDFDDLLSSRAEGVTNSITAYWNAKNNLVREAADGKDLALLAKNIDFVDAARDWVEEKRKDPDLMSIFVRILDAKENQVVASKVMPYIAPLDRDDLGDVLAGEDDFSTLDGKMPDGCREKFRVYTRPVYLNGAIAYIVQVSGPSHLASLVLNNLILWIGILIPLTAILAGAPGILLARVSLRPVDKMITTLRQITAENLKLRIHLPDTKDEIRRLADTFNSMIDRLERSFESHQRFIRDISDDIREPMNSLQKELEDAIAKGLAPEDAAPLLKRAASSMAQFSAMLESLFELSRCDEDNPFLEIRKVDAANIVRNAIDTMKPLAGQKDIALAFSGPDSCIIDGDGNQLKRLFMYLLDNAIKYTYRQGSVSVMLIRVGDFVKISVHDTGIGIPADERDYIFDRFYQVSRTRSSTRGFGVGLSNARLIAQEHKGSITVDSEEGKGSTFIVILPISYPG